MFPRGSSDLKSSLSKSLIKICVTSLSTWNWKCSSQIGFRLLLITRVFTFCITRIQFIRDIHDYNHLYTIQERMQLATNIRITHPIHSQKFIYHKFHIVPANYFYPTLANSSIHIIWQSTMRKHN